MNELATSQELSTQARQAYDTGNFPEAARLFKTAAEVLSAGGDRLGAAEQENNRSVALLKASDAQGALLAVQGTDQVFKQAGDVRRQAIALGNLAAALEASGKLTEALDNYQQSADLLKQVNDTELRTFALKNLSALQLRMGRQFEAMASMDAALNPKKKMTLVEKILKKLLKVPLRMLR
jgi:tetratricopeptide (TPR) repeat protein